MTVKARKWWSCPKCGYRNEGRAIKCRQTFSSFQCDGRRPKRRVPKHARTLRDDSYETYRQLNWVLHNKAHDGWFDPDCCGVCGKPPKARRHDRDHDHRTGKPRGLACWHCNRELLRHATLDELRLAVAYLERAAT